MSISDYNVHSSEFCFPYLLAIDQRNTNYYFDPDCKCPN